MACTCDNKPPQQDILHNVSTLNFYAISSLFKHFVFPSKRKEVWNLLVIQDKLKLLTFQRIYMSCQTNEFSTKGGCVKLL